MAATYEFEGKTYELPPIAKMPFGVNRKIQKAQAAKDSAALIDALLDDWLLKKYPETAELFEEIPSDEVQGLMEVWTGGEDLGKSSAS